MAEAAADVDCWHPEQPKDEALASAGFCRTHTEARALDSWHEGRRCGPTLLRSGRPESVLEFVGDSRPGEIRPVPGEARLALDPAGTRGQTGPVLLRLPRVFSSVGKRAKAAGCSLGPGGVLQLAVRVTRTVKDRHPGIVTVELEYVE